MSAQRGLFVVLEGLDRSGKTTQVGKLEERFRQDGKEVRVQKFPDRTTAIGKMIDAYLKQTSDMDDRAIHLLFAANRWECAKRIESDLDKRITVIADRYAFSGIAFSAAKGLDFGWVMRPDQDLPSPDLILYLTVPPSRASKREDYGAERYEKTEVQEKVKTQFEKVAECVNSYSGRSGVWQEIDGEGEIDEIHKRIWQIVQDMDQKERKPVGKLWR